MPVSFAAHVVSPDGVPLMETVEAQTLEALWPAITVVLSAISPGAYDVVWNVETPDERRTVAQIRVRITAGE